MIKATTITTAFGAIASATCALLLVLLLFLWPRSFAHDDRIFFHETTNAVPSRKFDVSLVSIQGRVGVWNCEEIWSGHVEDRQDTTWRVITSSSRPLRLGEIEDYTPWAPFTADSFRWQRLGFIIAREQTAPRPQPVQAPAFRESRSLRHFNRLFLVPHWFAALCAAVLPTTWAWRTLKRWQRRRQDRCINCGYDLRASLERCPECGTRAPERSTLSSPPRQ